MLTTQTKFKKCCVEPQGLTQWFSPCVSNLVVFKNNRKKKGELSKRSLVSLLSDTHSKHWALWVPCSSSRLHSTALLRYLQNDPLFKMIMKLEWFAFIDFHAYLQHWVLWELCFSSMLQSMLLLLFLQTDSLWVKCEFSHSQEKTQLMENLFFLLTIQIENSERCIGFQCFTQWFYSCISDFVTLKAKQGWRIRTITNAIKTYSHNSYWFQWVLDLISVHHSILLFLDLR